MDENTGKKKRRKLWGVLALLTLGFASLVIGVSGMHRKQALPVPPVAPVPASKPATQLPAKATKSAKPVSTALKIKPGAMDAVNAAVLADANLATAAFLPLTDLKATVSAYVVPSRLLREQFEVALWCAGALTATGIPAKGCPGPLSQSGDIGWGYQSTADAYTHAQITQSTQMYRVDSYSGKTAKVELFDYSSYMDQSDLQWSTVHRDMAITVMRMKRVGARWLLAAQPQDGAAPTFRVKPTFAQKLAAYQKFYLKGFSNYGNTS